MIFNSTVVHETISGLNRKQGQTSIKNNKINRERCRQKERTPEKTEKEKERIHLNYGIRHYYTFF